MKRVLFLAMAVSLLISSVSFAQNEEADDAIQFSTSIGIGSALIGAPDEFKDDWKPGFGMNVDVAAARSILELALSLDYSFFLSDTAVPNDVNILTAFINIKVKPLNTTARPYLFLGGGGFRYWIVDENLYDNSLGFGGGVGVEVEIDQTRRIYIEGKTLQGRTRQTARQANTEVFPIRVGITFAFK